MLVTVLHFHRLYAIFISISDTMLKNSIARFVTRFQHVLFPELANYYDTCYSF